MSAPVNSGPYGRGSDAAWQQAPRQTLTGGPVVELPVPPEVQVTPIPKAGPKPKATRKRVKPMSDKRRAGISERAAVRAAVFERDGHRCVVHGLPDAGPCHGPLTPHHVRKASQGGAYAVSNLVAACEGHNSAIEDRPDWAHAHGLVLRHGDPDPVVATPDPRTAA